ncbi:nicotinamide mononucleotide transporter family protein [Streptomyces sp. MP131-18]|uniref:nicotinamide mononucleotide transporter family protein n=1 Tax=Streptomyces sp. MP131-18 TaxID=1857892 RepID=UPI00097BEF94|nr:nicotinamide mononucleotide transporter family protein [Streptomyces sp. MP131-18]ONK15763.1 nicotinamide riboside transporter PnuC [Streptomyces sp. MP131-18]
MSLVDQLNATAFSAFGQDVMWSDMTGNLAGLAALALGWRRSIFTWPVQLLSGLILVAAYTAAQLGGGVGKQLLVVTVALWGWRQWQLGRRQSGDGQIVVRFATWPERAVLAIGTVVGTLVVGGLFSAFPDLSWNPWPDAYIFVGTLAAMFAQARGLVEFWFAWLLVDVVGVPLAFSSGLPFSGLVYVVYLFLVLWGLRDWWRRSRTADPRPVPEGATT